MTVGSRSHSNYTPPLVVNQNIGSHNLKVGLVFGCLKIMTDLTMIIRDDSFVKQLWWYLMTNFSLEMDLSHI